MLFGNGIRTKIMNKQQFEKYKLKNGVRVVLVPDSKAVAVLAQVLVETGSAYENKSNNGISHFLEHMVFKGTKRRPSTKIIAEEVDGIGGQMNAFTGQEETGYWIKMPSDYGELAIDLVADIYLNPLLEQKEINRERGVILQEMAMYEDLPMRKVEEEFEELLYGDQPTGWKIIGTKENIENMKRKDMKKYMEDKYLSKSTVVTVAGNFDIDKVKKQIEELFGLKKNNKRKLPKKKTIEKQSSPQIKLVTKSTDQTHLVLGFRSVDMYNKKKYALNLLSTILGGGMSSRMFLNIREREGLAYYIHTSSELGRDAGVFVIQAGVAKENLEKTVNLILKEIKKITNQKVLAKELRKAKERLKGNVKIGLETVQSKAGFFGNQELFYEKVESPEEILVKYEKITAEDIQKVAKEIFKNSKLNLAVIGPHKDKKGLKNILKVLVTCDNVILVTK
jgi:predicted Zn-dependent peptidase